MEVIGMHIVADADDSVTAVDIKRDISGGIGLMTSRDQNTLYPGLRRGYLSRRSLGGDLFITLKRKKAIGRSRANCRLEWTNLTDLKPRGKRGWIEEKTVKGCLMQNRLAVPRNPSLEATWK